MQLQSECTTPAQKSMMNNILNEIEIKSKLQNNRLNAELYSMLHITRCLDGALKLFLEINNILSSEKALGHYLKKLTNHSSQNLNTLKENLRGRYQSDIVDKRNIYMHSSGAFPTKREYENVENSVCCCLQTILNLKK